MAQCYAVVMYQSIVVGAQVQKEGIEFFDHSMKFFIYEMFNYFYNINWFLIENFR